MRQNSSSPDLLLTTSVFGRPKIAEPMGICILAAACRHKGYSVDIVDPSVQGLMPTETAKIAVSRKPIVVGLSVLRDRNAPDALAFLAELKQLSPDLTVVIGGHGPSLALTQLMWLDGRKTEPASRAAQELRGISPQGAYWDTSGAYLDMLALGAEFLVGEADYTLPDYLAATLEGRDRARIPGLVWQDPQGIVHFNPPPDKVGDLDLLPWMARDVLADHLRAHPHTAASILASRGCAYHCSFCSVHEYERLQPGPRHRWRSAQSIFDEMTYLHGHHQISTFHFEDDNFVVANRKGFDRIDQLINLLAAAEWQIQFSLFCRADVVTEERFRALRDVGLTGVYIGIESASDADLAFFDKSLSVGQSERALTVLERLGFSARVGSPQRIMVGYITWHPYTTLESLRDTRAFLARHAAPPKLLRRKLRLYAATRAIRDVKEAGLLDPTHPDGWHFADPRMESLQQAVEAIFQLTSAPRDSLRTLEKTMDAHQTEASNLNHIRRMRSEIDNWLISAFDALVADTANSKSYSSIHLQPTYEDLSGAFSRFMEINNVSEAVSDGYRQYGLDTRSSDLYRR